MTLKTNIRLFERLIPSLALLRDEAARLEEQFADELSLIEPVYRASARNLLHYLGVRNHDIRNLQRDLASLGLSSLGVLEAHTMSSLNAVLEVLGQLTGRDTGPPTEAPVDFRTGPLLLRDHTRTLLGHEPANRTVRIMVTMPAEAATRPQLVRDLLLAGSTAPTMRPTCGERWWTTCARRSGRSVEAAGSRRTSPARSCVPADSRPFPVCSRCSPSATPPATRCGRRGSG